MATKRLALLLCDTPIPAVQATDGDYSAIFHELLQKSLPNPSAPFVLDSFDVKNKMEYPDDVDKYDGILMTGSAASAYENLEWINKLVAFTASVAETKPNVKLIGICFGHQIISRALGKDCVPNGGTWEVGPTKLDLTETGKQVFGVDTLNIEQMHRDHVPEVPSGCHLLASTPVSYNQGYVRYATSKTTPSLEDIQIFTVQGHPEFTKRIVDSIVDARASTGAIDKVTADDARTRSTWRNDGVEVIGKAIWRVLGVDA
ncbi:hypothetical protein NM688_g930 [Phlebia brevispora]|uniref:Uncharacterized protein n=1 Tax=Phlebia brevispora TaxID=194682 RepID=A0ACC1TD21_9APHY|nr:hypothetical protein NM688_g930 [Phlebia brevispora]